MIVDLASPYPSGVTKSTPQDRKKFDLQLNASLIYERRLAEIFSGYKIEKVELKSESHLWERTGNICIEYAFNGQPSGITATEADFWVHELVRDGKTLFYIMLPMRRVKELALEAHSQGRYRDVAGDGGKSSVILLKLQDLLFK